MNRSEVSQESSRSSDPPEPDAATPPPAPAPPAHSSAERPAFFTFLGAEAVALVFYMSISRPMWFYLDEWDFLANRTGGNLDDLFRAHNEHWVTLPVLVYRAMWSIFGINTYRPYQLLIVLMHLGAALLVRTVMRRVGVRPWTATVVAGAFVFFGSGYQNIVLPFQITLVGSLVFGLVHLLLATHDGPLDRRDWFGLAAGLAGLMCSGVGVSMVVAVGFAVLLARGWRLALLHTVPLAAVYLLWYRWIGHVGYNGYRARPGQVVSFVRSLVAASFRAMGHGGVARTRARRVARGRPARRVEAAAVRDVPPAGRDAARPARRRASRCSRITGLGRAGIHSFQEKSRYLHLVAAMTFPAARRRRRRDHAAMAVAVAHRRGARGVRRVDPRQPQHDRRLHAPADRQGPGAVQADDAVDPARAHREGGAALGQARPVPRALRDRRLAPRRRCVGQDPATPPAHAGRRVDEPVAALVPADLRTAEAAHDVRRDQPHRSAFDLQPGQRIVVLAPSGSLRITPTDVPLLGTYPFPLITTVGNNLTTVRPVNFRIMNKSAPYGRDLRADPHHPRARRPRARRDPTLRRATRRAAPSRRAGRRAAPGASGAPSASRRGPSRTVWCAPARTSRRGGAVRRSSRSRTVK